MNFRYSVCFLAIGLVAGACSSSGLHGDVYRGDGLSFRLGPIPPSWKRLDVENVRLAFRDDVAESSVLVNGRCSKDGDDIPLQALTQHLFMTFTERETLEQKVIPMDGREAMHTVLRAKLDGVSKMFDAYVLKKDGCVYDFVVITTPDKFDANRPPFEAFVSGFHTLREDG